MFKGKPGKENKNWQVKASKYYTRVKVIFNEKAYANSSNFIDWIRQDYNKALAYLFADHEPRLLVLDAFTPYKHSEWKEDTKERDCCVKV
jgi:hypothetical protein